MKGGRKVLYEPVDHVFRRMAAGLLEDAHRHGARLGDANDAEALHDFRVSVRRLRGYVKSYRNEVGLRGLRRLARRLRKLARATNPGRDRQVQLRWLSNQLDRPHTGRLRQSGLRLMLDELRVQDRRRPAAPLDAARRFGTVTQRFLRHLKGLRHHGKGPADPARTYAAVTGRIVLDQVRKLRARLLLLERAAAARMVHAPRLTVKRIRYILEPVAGNVRGAPSVIRRLRKVQDALGAIRDVQLLNEAVGRAVERDTQAWTSRLLRYASASRPLPSTAALLAVAGALRREEERRLRALRRQWLGPRTQAWLGPLEQLAAALLAPPSLPVARAHGPATKPGRAGAGGLIL